MKSFDLLPKTNMELSSELLFDEDNSSIYSSPSNSPNLLNLNSTFSTLIENHQKSNKIVNTQPTYLTRENLESNEKTITSEEELNKRGRTNRKRSNSKQSFVCVLAWLVKPFDEDEDHDQGRRSKILLEYIQSVRRKYDAAHSRWEPHVTLIPPFVIPFKMMNSAKDKVEEENSNEMKIESETIHSQESKSIREIQDPFQTLSILCERIEEICSNFHSIPIEFDEISKFSLKRYDSIHLRPNQNDLIGTKTLINLQNSLTIGLPETIEFSRSSVSPFSAKKRQSLKQNNLVSMVGNNNTNNNNGQINNPELVDNSFKPHLTLGQAVNAEKAKELNDLVSPLVDRSEQLSGPLRVKMDKIQLLFKPINRSGPYDIYKEFKLKP